MEAKEIYKAMKEIDDRLWELQRLAACKGFFSKEEAVEKRRLEGTFGHLAAELECMGLERFRKR
jgi:hypothetical protein